MSFSLDVIDKLSALITAAFGLVAALAWNSAIQEIFKEVFGEQSSIPAMVGYAVFVTVIAVIFTLWFIIGYFHTCIQRVTTRCCLNGASLRYCCNHRAVHF